VLEEVANCVHTPRALTALSREIIRSSIGPIADECETFLRERLDRAFLAKPLSWP